MQLVTTERSEKEILLSQLYNLSHNRYQISEHIDQNVYGILIDPSMSHADLYTTLQLLVPFLCRDTDNAYFNEVIFQLHDYAFKYDCDNKKLVVMLSDFLNTREGGIYANYEEMITDLVLMIHSCIRLPDKDDEYEWLRTELVGLIGKKPIAVRKG